LATLAFGNSENGATYARLEEEPYIFSIADQLVAALPTTEFSFRTLDVLDLRRDQLVSLLIARRGEGPVELVRSMEGKWILEGREDHQNDAQVQLFLNTLTGLRAAAWAGNAKPQYGLDQPSLVIKVRYQSRGQNREVDVKFGTANAGNQHYGLTTEEAGVFLLDDPQFKRLSAPLTQ
jgi:hypothetical protein